MDPRSRPVIPRRYAEYYLGNAPSLTWLLFANVAAVLVGVRYYVGTLPDVSTFLWPLYADSPAAVFLMALSLATLLPLLGRPLSAVPHNRVLAYLHTLAFAWLVKFGLWTAVALNLRVGAYFPDPWGYFGILLTHLGFVLEAYLIPHYGRTTRGALALALGLLLLNDLLDYGLGYHPPLRYEPGATLAVASVALSLLTVALARHAFETSGDESAG
ncbi:DUF1405 domain-containing protein [Halobacteriales archaeon QS_1_68_17]|nr:MAG: DUF1405 domain-containing protein [Halobacteriales archaeon QS_1_68_17]